MAACGLNKDGSWRSRMAKPYPVTDSDFEEKVLKASQPVLVDFWAEWCGPCKMIAPVVDDLAQDYDGKMEFAKLDVDGNSSTAMAYGVRSIPTLLIFQNGQPVAQVVGAVSKGALKKHIDSVLDA